MKIALVRGAFLNQYEGQIYYPLALRHEITGFSSLHPIHDSFPFKVEKLLSPIDIDFGYLSHIKMPILNRVFVDAHLLIGLEQRLRGFDIAHCAETYYQYTQQCLAAKRMGNVKKVVSTVFENIPFNNETIWGRRNFKRKSIEGVDHFIAISERAAASLVLEGCNPKKITVIGQHIDTKIFYPIINRTSSSNVNVLFVGRLEFYKGVYDLLFAAKRLSEDVELADYKLKFTFVGFGTEEKGMHDMVARLGIGKIVIFKAAKYSEMPKIYQGADIFVAPSRETRTFQEQFGTVLLEAQASGLPIVTTASGGIPETVGDAAMLSNPGDFYSISISIKKFILNKRLRHSYGRKARFRALRFDILGGSRKIESIYESTLRA